MFYLLAYTHTVVQLHRRPVWKAKQQWFRSLEIVNAVVMHRSYICVGSMVVISLVFGIILTLWIYACLPTAAMYEVPLLGDAEIQITLLGDADYSSTHMHTLGVIKVRVALKIDCATVGTMFLGCRPNMWCGLCQLPGLYCSMSSWSETSSVIAE